jgi:hypothetical protein
MQRRPSPENAVNGLMLILIAVGLGLFLAARLIARVLVGREGDPVGIMRIIQVVAVILMIGALFIRPHRNDTAAFPPPPDTPVRTQGK